MAQCEYETLLRIEKLLDELARRLSAQPTTPATVSISPSQGCVCPPGAEATCAGWNCARRPPRGVVLAQTTIQG